MGKRLSAAFDWAFDRLFSKIQLANEQFVYIALVSRFYRVQCYLVVSKVPGFPITATERPEVVYKAKTPADQILFTARIMANGVLLYHDLVYEVHKKRRWDLVFMKLWYVKPWLQKRRI